MRLLLTTAVALVAATTAFAGNIAYVAPEVVAIEEPARMGGSGAWLIPLVIVAVLALALTSDSDEEDDDLPPPPNPLP